MIQTITMRGLGPHDDTTLALFGTTGEWIDIEGHSEAGKSETMEAVCFALWGEAPDGSRLGTDAIRDGHDKCEAEVVLLNGMTVARTMTAKRTLGRRIQRPGLSEVFPKSDREMLGLLGPLGKDTDLARLVMMPMSWVPLAQGEGGGRPLRDALARILPAAPIQDVVARLMAAAGQEMREGDPTDEAGARKLVTDANRAVNNRNGEVHAIEGQVVKAEERAQRAQGPSLADVDAAGATLRLAAAWSQYETLGAAVGAYEREVQARTAWQERRAALGERPDDNGEAIAQATEWRNLARATAADKRRALDTAGRALADAQRAESRLRSTPPAIDAAATASERAALERAQQAAAAARQQLAEAEQGDPATFPEVRQALAELNGARVALRQAEQAAAEPTPTGPCSHCGSSEWPHAEQRAAHLAEELDAATRDHAEAEAEHAAALKGAEARKAEHLIDCEEDVRRADAAVSAARQVLADAERAAEAAAAEAHNAAIEAAAVAAEQARAAVQRAEEAECEAQVVLEQAEAARDAAVAAGTAAREWDAAARALGAEPTVRPAPQGAVQAPARPKPSAMELAGARSVLDAAERARGAAAQRGATVDELRHDLEEAREKLATAEAEAARCAALLECVRKAPSEAVRQSIEGLEAGPVTLQLEGTGVQVLIDGRRWQRASTGRQVVADLYLRAALRAHLDLGQGRPATWLPLFVDRAQDWSGPWPEIPGPVVRIFTTTGQLAAVRAESAVAAR